MADNKKPQRKRYVSPAGTAVYPYLTKPDTKFKEEGEYRVKLRLSGEDAKPLRVQVEAAMAEARKLEKLIEAKKKNPKTAIPENWPFKEVIDDNGDETGEIEFNFAASASGTSKKDGKPWTRTVDVFDAKKNKLPAGTEVWSGSTIKVAYTIGTYFINTKVGYGVKLYLEAAQVIELVQGGNKNADAYGFGEEDGYEAEDEKAPETAVTGDGGDGDDEDF